MLSLLCFIRNMNEFCGLLSHCEYFIRIKQQNKFIIAFICKYTTLKAQFE